MKDNLLFLFDIDGTLLSPGLLPREILNRVFFEFTGTDPDIQFSEVAGLTDYLIIQNTLTRLGIVDGRMPDMREKVLQAYLAEMRELYPRSGQPVLYQDAVDFLDAVQIAGHFTALLTGNVQVGAQIKLGRFNLFERFSFGAFGDDSINRENLVPIAQARAVQVLGINFNFSELIIVGDTPSDAHVAHCAGAKSIIVCRRPGWEDEIRLAGADIVVNHLDDTHDLLNRLYRLYDQ